MRPRARDFRQAADEVERHVRRQATIDALKAAVGVDDRPSAAVFYGTVLRVWLAAAWTLMLLILLITVLVELVSA